MEVTLISVINVFARDWCFWLFVALFIWAIYKIGHRGCGELDFFLIVIVAVCLVCLRVLALLGLLDLPGFFMDPLIPLTVREITFVATEDAVAIWYLTLGTLIGVLLGTAVLFIIGPVRRAREAESRMTPALRMATRFLEQIEAAGRKLEHIKSDLTVLVIEG